MGVEGFTPIQASLGGLIIGCASAAFLLAHGRILGCSGLYTMFLSGEDRSKAIDAGSVLTGLVLGSVICFFGYDEFSFPGLLDFPNWRYAVGAFAVGLGAQRGSGCTSGHGISGLARLSKRSIYAVGTFMTTAFITASVSQVVTAKKAAFGFAPISIPTAEEAILPVVATLVLPLLLFVTERIGKKFFLCTYKADIHVKSMNMDRACHLSKIVLRDDSTGDFTDDASLAADYESPRRALEVSMSGVTPEVLLPCREYVRFHMGLCGFVFAVGLGVSGMTSQVKILDFLALTNGAWDPSLAFVMGFGLIPSFVANRIAKRRIEIDACPSLGLHFSVPSRSEVDLRLISGAAVFGCGWAFSGWCPGPALANLLPVFFGRSTATAFYIINMALGIWIGRLYDHAMGERAAGNHGSLLTWTQRARMDPCDVCG